MDLETMTISLGICVALPVLIVWFITRVSINRDNRKTAVLIEALKSNNPVDVDVIAKTLAQTNSRGAKTPLEQNNAYLLRGCIFSFLGLAAVIICGIVGYMGGASSDGITILMIISGVCFALGLSYLIVYFVVKKQLKANGNLLHE